MGIERKQLTMSDRERLSTAIHEAGHAIVCLFTEGARELYKATIVSRGGSLGATFTLPSEADQVSITKQQVLAQIDVAMGGHVAEELIMNDSNITSGCGSDLKNATDMAKRAIRQFGMFGEEGASFMSTQNDETSDAYNQKVDAYVKNLLDESHARVSKLIHSKESELRKLAKGLFWYDYLDKDEIQKILKGEELSKPKV